MCSGDSPPPAAVFPASQPLWGVPYQSIPFEQDCEAGRFESSKCPIASAKGPVAWRRPTASSTAPSLARVPACPPKAVPIQVGASWSDLQTASDSSTLSHDSWSNAVDNGSPSSTSCCTCRFTSWDGLKDSSTFGLGETWSEWKMKSSKSNSNLGIGNPW